MILLKISLVIFMVGNLRDMGLAPLFSLPEVDQQAIVMIVLGFPIMERFALLAAKWFGRPASTGERGSTASVLNKA
jgi:hypothetical protein